MKIIFCGYGRAAQECLWSLLTHCGVKAEDILAFTYRADDNKPFVDTLKALNIEYSLKPVNKEAKKIRNFKAACLLSVYYRDIISDEILKLVNHKAMNIHPSILPDYRGCFSCVWAILNGEKETGITFHYMTKEADRGNIILQRKIKIAENDTAYSLYHKAVTQFVAHFPAAFKRLCQNVKGEVQRKGVQHRFYYRQVPFGGKLYAKEVTYALARRFVRAMYFPPLKGAEFVFNGFVKEIQNVNELSDYKDKFKAGQ